MSDDFEIATACDVADDIMEYLVELRIMSETDQHDGNDEDPSGFTPIGRELFELIYNRIRGIFE
jgi:hypothetical protein